MKSSEIRKKFIEFFEGKGHKLVPSSSLIPTDPSVLFTSAGMQQFKKYFTGELDPIKDFGNKNVISIQKCFRTSDIDEVGDESHLTFLEMLGNFSFGGYFKEDAIKYAHEFITCEMGLKIEYVTVFNPEKIPNGDWRKDIPKDEESRKIWKELGIRDEQIRDEGIDVFWGPTGDEGPCGATTEIYINGMEVWNIVFNEFYCDNDQKLTPLKIKGVDTGMGLERLAAVSQKVKTIFETDLFSDIFQFPTAMNEKKQRIMLDHSRAVTFLIADNIRPSNREQGYLLRRLIRRMMTHFYKMAQGSYSKDDISGTDFIDVENLLIGITRKYKSFYNELDESAILSVFREENSKFMQAMRNGIRELNKIDVLDAKKAFNLFESYGLTYEVIKDIAGEKAKNVIREEFEKEFKRHQKVSRAGVEKKFGGHGLLVDTGELKAGDEEELKKAIRLHTATHLLNQALREILGNTVEQRGSDINAERARFDFSFERKLTLEELKTVENKTNEKIKENLTVSFKEMKKEEAEKTGALHFFKAKYPDIVKVYFVSKDGEIENAWSKEFCNGPHVSKTGEIGGIKILKEEASSAGVRRIRLSLSR